MRFRRVITCSLVPLLLLSATAFAQDPDGDAADKDYTDQLPRIPFTPAQDVASTFEVHRDFKFEQVAAEPLVRDPIAMAFDEYGRMFVVEMTGYSENRDDIPGTIRMLEDTDGDGVYDKDSVYVDNLPWPVAVTCWDGGIFVGAPPDILYCKDTDGDGKADVRKVVYTGFGLSNVQGMFNTFLWGPDNTIHGAGSSSGGSITRPDDPTAPAISVSGRNFKFDPRTMKFETTTSSSQHGMTFDDWGNQFECSNSDHIQYLMYEDRYAARNPFLEAPSSRISIAEDGASADVFRISPVEPWRIVRTRLRAKGIVPGIVEGGGRPAGYFTSATGVTLYRGDAWPAEYRNNAIIGDVGSNLIHRKIVDTKGVGFTARRADAGVEFVASKDIWFRPCQFAVGPDGNLYVADMYREVIEHPASLPEVIKKHLDLTSGNDRGRIYRVVHKSWQQKPVPRLGDMTSAELVPLLAHANQWHRETATRLLYQRQDATVVPALQKLANESPSALGRVTALRTLDGLAATTPEVLLTSLSDVDAHVREAGIKLSEKHLASSQTLFDKLAAMVDDTDLRVRYQIAFSLGESAGKAKSFPLAILAKSDGADPWVRLAVLSSITDAATPVMLSLLTDDAYRKKPESADVITAVAKQTGAMCSEEELAAVLKAVEALPETETALAQTSVRDLLNGLKTAGKGGDVRAALVSSPRAQQLLEDMIASAREIAVNGEADADARVDAIQTLSFDTFDSVKELLPPLFDQRQPADVQMAALASLRRFSDPSVGELLVGSWSAQSPALRTRTIEALFSRKPWLDSMLGAIERGEFTVANLDSTRIESLKANTDPEVQPRVAKIFEGQVTKSRKEIVDAYQSVLTLQGDKARGKELFTANCAQCHRMKGVGHDVGPDLTTVVQAGAEKILTNVLDPNAEVNPQYINFSIETTDFESHSGIVVAETANSITLKRANGETSTILRSNIETIRSENKTIMPEGWEQTLNQQALADVIAFLTAAE